MRTKSLHPKNCFRVKDALVGITARSGVNRVPAPVSSQPRASNRKQLAASRKRLAQWSRGHGDEERGRDREVTRPFDKSLDDQPQPQEPPQQPPPPPSAAGGALDEAPLARPPTATVDSSLTVSS